MLKKSLKKLFKKWMKNLKEISISHSENSMLSLLDVVRSNHYGKTQHFSCVSWKNDSIIPKSCCWKVTAWFLLVGIHYRFLDLLLLFFWKLFSFSFKLGLLHLSQNTCSLLTTHNCNFSTWPHIKHSWSIGSSTHSVITGSIRSAD